MSHPFAETLGAASRALAQVVAPALDPANPLAREQLALVQRFLRLIQERADELGARARAELAISCAQGQRLQALAGFAPPDVQQALADALAAGCALQLDRDASPETLRAAADRLDALESTLVRFAARAEPATRRALRRAVIEGAAPRLALRRAWFAPLGLDPEMHSVPAWRDACRPFTDNANNPHQETRP